MNIKIFKVVPVIIFLLILTSCDKDEPSAPSVTTNAVTGITQTAAAGGGNVTKDGGSAVTARGICWSTVQGPTVSGNKTTDGTGTGAFTSNLTGLTPYTEYYVRAYATNSTGTGYGNETSFRTSQLSPPAITTGAITSLTHNSATAGGSVSYDGGSPVISKGVCWATSANPITGDNKTNDGSGTGTFTSSVTGLQPTTTYYLRAYATNSAGTSYGQQKSFKTYSGSVTDIDGNIYPTIIIGTKEWMAANLKTTQYKNGDLIPNVENYADWGDLTTGGRCENTLADNFVSTYGWFYNWYAVADLRNICPTGWHVPTDYEWTALTDYLGGENVAGGKLKEAGTAHWESPNTGATNETGFTALPAAFRTPMAGFAMPGNMGTFWTSSEYDPTNAYNRILFNSDATVSRVDNAKNIGMSIRCVKD